MKLVYLLWESGDGEAGDLARSLREKLAPQLLALEPEKLVVNVADVEADVSGSMPLVRNGAALAGLVSTTLRDVDARGPVEALLGSAGGKLAGYRVDESVPLAYADRDWPDGERTPGAKLVTAFDKPAGLAYDAFIAEWHGVHTPLSFEIHPMWCYIRNVVEEALTRDAPHFLGIVEEQFRTLEDITDPERFYSGIENMGRVAAHVPKFIDLTTMHTALMSEHILRS